jgi:hypothetical protein
MRRKGGRCRAARKKQSRFDALFFVLASDRSENPIPLFGPMLPQFCFRIGFRREQVRTFRFNAVEHQNSSDSLSQNGIAHCGCIGLGVQRIYMLLKYKYDCIHHVCGMFRAEQRAV